MSIEKLRAMIGNAPPSPFDTELRRNVRDALIEHDAIAHEGYRQARRIGRLAEIAGKLLRHAGPLCDVPQADSDMRSDLQREITLLSRATLKPDGDPLVTRAELDAVVRALEAERDADRANMAMKSTELEKLVGEATANEALVEKKNLALIDAVKRPWVAAEQYHWGSGFNGLFNVARREAVDGPVTWEHYGSGGYEREHAEALVAKLNAQVIDSIEAMT